jgi:hypothetical protein
MNEYWCNAIQYGVAVVVIGIFIDGIYETIKSAKMVKMMEKNADPDERYRSRRLEDIKNDGSQLALPMK